MQSNEICYSIADFWTWDGAMWEQLRWLRTNDPVHWSELDQLFVLTRFEDTAYVSKHNDLFCSGDGVLPVNGIKLGLIDEDEPLFGGDATVDSIGSLEIIAALEREYDFHIPDDDLRVELFDSV